ncbi:MAG: 60S ribosomal export protein NMD3 [Aeropyrum sp.]|nr:60S ribosomal export protein NMD3 [Aeropyrum sp.]
MVKTCISCGRKGEILIKGLCIECFKNKIGIARLRDNEIAVEMCTWCGRVRIGHKWYSHKTPEDAVGDVIVRRLKPMPSEHVDRVEVSGWVLQSKLDWRTRVVVELRASVGNTIIRDSKSVVVRFKPSKCPDCVTRVSGEYDTLVQVRGSRARQIVYRVLANLGGELGILDVVETREGVDLYFSHRGGASRFLSALKSEARVKISRVEHEHVGLSGGGRRRSRKTISARIDEP